MSDLQSLTVNQVSVALLNVKMTPHTEKITRDEVLLSTHFMSPLKTMPTLLFRIVMGSVKKWSLYDAKNEKSASKSKAEIFK